MKRLAAVLAAVAAFLLGAGRAASDPAWAGQCGIPAGETVWADYVWPTLLPVLARPGTVLALTNSGSTDYSAKARALGAATYSFDLIFKDKVGTPQAPADPSTIAAAAQKQYNDAVKRSGGCSSPLVVDNELFGAGNVTPWSESTTQYRADVLAYLQDLAALGAHPVLLVARSPYLGSPDAVSWWLQVAQVSDIVREDYIPAPPIWKMGVVLGNRLLRERYREAVGEFTAIGIPASRLGIMVSVLSQKGGGGRSGLKPASAWFQVVKWYALSAKEVAHELGLGSVFSWGWQEWNPAEVDPDKPNAACVWLWVRKASLCDAPHKLGSSFDASRSAGQIALPAGALCRVPGFGTVGSSAVTRLTAVTGDSNAALSILFERLIEEHYAGASSDAVAAAERAVIDQWFGGSRSAYVAALAQAHATVTVARSLLADEIRRAELAQTQGVAAPGAPGISGFYRGYPQLLVRRVHVSPQAPWLGGAGYGYALSGAAPARVFTAAAGRTSRVQTLLGAYTIKPVGTPVPLGSLPLGTVRLAIVAALEGFARAQAVQRWTIAEQRTELDVTTCRADDLPEPSAVDITQDLPFLALQ